MKQPGQDAANLQIDTLGLDYSQDITLRLINSDPSEASLPATIVIPAGSSGKSVSISAVDDNILDGTQSVQFSVQLGNLVSPAVSLQVLDREIIRLALNVTQVREDAGPGAAVLRVSRSNTDIANPLEVFLKSSDVAVATVLSSVTIPANASSIDVSIAAIDDSITDGDHDVLFTSEALGYFGSTASLRVQDYEPLQWVEQTIAIAESSVIQPSVITIQLPAPAPPSGGLLNLSADLEGQLQYPNQVFIPGGQTTATISVSAINDAFAESPKTVKLKASGAGLESATISINLSDDDRSIWTNSSNVFDVSGDGSLDPLDVLLIINFVRRSGTGSLPSTRDPLGPPFIDVNGNGLLEPLDILLVVNAMSRRNR